jgi:hypothetical protein
MDGDVDAVAGAGHGLVDGVVDDLEDHVVQGLGVGAADVHARPPADGLEALQDLDAVGGVLQLARRLGHGPPRF